jgi:membrane-bound ClpP family serine protease
VLLLSLAATGEGRADESLRNEFYGSLAGAGAAIGDAAGGGDGAIEDGPTALLVTGVIGPGSYDEFRSALDHGTPQLVVIDGPGGVLGEALMIGQEVRRRHLNTLVGAHRSCASACAVVFLSGRTKYVGAGAVIGLHSASYADGRADPEATQVMADYLRGVGVPNATLRRMANTAPSDIRWLTKAEQRAVGIQVFRGSTQ